MPLTRRRRHRTLELQFSPPQVVLLGDAAHAMTPMLGQGANAGLEDALVFAEILVKHGDDVDAALPAYPAARLPDIRGLLCLNECAADNLLSMVRHSNHKLLSRAVLPSIILDAVGLHM